jgi:hypothetical protein
MYFFCTSISFSAPLLPFHVHMLCFFSVLLMFLSHHVYFCTSISMSGLRSSLSKVYIIISPRERPGPRRPGSISFTWISSFLPQRSVTGPPHMTPPPTALAPFPSCQGCCLNTLRWFAPASGVHGCTLPSRRRLCFDLLLALLPCGRTLLQRLGDLLPARTAVPDFYQPKIPSGAVAMAPNYSLHCLRCRHAYII